jgi:signal transduction histidine kinase
MGLAIYHSIFEAYNGLLWAASTDSPEAMLFFTLPIEESAKPSGYLKAG